MDNKKEKEEFKGILHDFLIEADELVEQIDHDLVELEDSHEDLELLNKIFRAVHTIKGSSSFLDLENITSTAHQAEDILNKLRKGEIKVNGYIMDALLRYIDHTKMILDDIKKGNKNTNVDNIIRELKLIREGHTEGSAEKVRDHEISKKGKKKSPQIRKAVSKIGQTIRVEVSRLDSLMNLVGELVLGRNRLVQISSEVAKESKTDNDKKGYVTEQLLETTSQLGLITTELQLAIMKTRMVPIGKVFNKFPRIVRDMCRDLNKEIDLVIAGEDTELDKSVIESISDPLIHMIRNALDHGIESISERKKLGKPVKGKVEMSAAHTGNHIVIDIKDDGRGLSPDFLIRKGIEKNLITKEEIARMGKDDILGLIFKPGFSTSDNVTNVSGRGVGLDVVRTNIEKLNGIVSIDSEEGKGTGFQLKLPLTLAIIQSLLVDVSSEIFAIPLVSVIETVKINEKEIHNLEGSEVLNLRENVLSLIRLREIFSLEETFSKNIYVVVIALAEKHIGIVVDRLMGQEEIVIKSLGSYLSGHTGIAGGTIMGDGRVRLIIDPSGLMEIASKMPKKMKKRKNISDLKEKSHAINVLVVDDSATDRKMIHNLLSSTGWINSMETSNSKDAIKIMNNHKFDLLLIDLIMPKIDGYSLVKSLREKGFKEPMVAITARGDIADSKQVELSGFNNLILKPINLHEIVSLINELISKQNIIN